MSTTPLLHNEGGDSSHREESGKSRALSPFNVLPKLSMFRGPSTAHDAIYLFLNEDNQEQQDQLTKNWRDHKLEELNFVGTVGALLASCLSSTSAWPDVLNNGRDKPWTVRSLWFSGLVFALFSVVIAGLQSMRLHRLSAHPDGLDLIRRGLSGRRTTNGRARPTWLQVWAWEFSLAFLVTSVLCMVVGIAVLVWVSTEYGPNKPEDGGWWDENAKMAVTFTSVLAFALAVVLSSQTVLMGSQG